jgi:hypothetical protein
MLRKDIGVGRVWTGNGNFPFVYVLKMSLHRGVVGLKKAKIPLGNIKMVVKVVEEIGKIY